MDDKSTSAPTLPQAATVAYGGHPSQFIDIYTPEGAGPHPVVVLIHGGFWRLPWGRDLMQGLAADLVGRGFAAVNVEYRRLGEEGGGWPGTCEDVAAALQALVDVAADLRAVGDGEVAGGEVTGREGRGLDLGRVGLVGHSAGGHLALWAAKHAPVSVVVRVVVSQAGVVDLRAAAREGLDGNAEGRVPAAVEFVGGGTDDVDFDAAYSLASPIEFLPLGPGVHQLVLHGDADNRVPFQQSVDYVAAARGVGDSVTFAAFTGMGHFEVIDAAHASWLRVVGELARRLGA